MITAASSLQLLATASASLEASPASRSKERWLYFFVTCNSSHLLPFILLLTLARCVVTLSALAAEGTKFCKEVVNASLDCRDNIKSTCSESGFNEEESKLVNRRKHRVKLLIFTKNTTAASLMLEAGWIKVERWNKRIINIWNCLSIFLWNEFICFTLWAEITERKQNFRFAKRKILLAFERTGSTERALVPVLLRITHQSKSGVLVSSPKLYPNWLEVPI